MNKPLPFLCSILSVLLLIALTFAVSLSAEEINSGKRARFNFNVQQDAVTFSQYDINNIVSWVGTNGHIVSFLPTGGGSGLFFPKGSGNTAVFASGLWVIGKVGEGLRSASAEFTTEFVAGPFGGDPESPRNKIFRVSPNYPDGLDINGDGDFDDAFDDIRIAGISTTTGEFDPWSAWPVENGAPVDANGNPAILGDGMMWMVFNDGDPAAHGNLWSTAPLGIEIQTSLFGFNRDDPIDNIMFVKWLIINKGGNTIDSTFVSIWSDCDIGTAGDDLVGVDTLTNLGYMYNGDAIDGVYGATPPAVGYDLFQGPIIPSPGDAAFAFGRKIQDFKNVPMTSFIQGTKNGPPFWDPETAEEAYNLLRGFTTFGDTILNPITNQPTKFAVTGDPVTGEGWLAVNPRDHRLLVNSGPFTMAPGDSQEVVVAVILAQGMDNLNAISTLRLADRLAQSLYDTRFNFPIAVAPEFEIEELDRELMLTWDAGKEKVESVNRGGYRFEGYNVYQGGSLDGPWKRLATFDLDNDVGPVFDLFFDLETGLVDDRPTAFGRDTGIQRFLLVQTNALNDDLRLINNRRHYFAITSYLINLDGFPRVFESPIEGKVAMPHEPDPGDVLNTEAGEELDIEHTRGVSDAKVSAQVIRPELITGDSYRIEFEENQTWGLFNLTQNRSVLQNQPDSRGGLSNEIAEGLLVTVDGLVKGPTTFFHAWQTETINHQGVGLRFAGDALLLGKETGLAQEFFGGGSLDPLKLRVDLELRFTGTTDDATVQGVVTQGGQIATQFERRVLELDPDTQNSLDDFLHTPVQVPFELWDIENDRQLNVVVINRNVDGGSPYGDGIGDPNIPGVEPRWRITGGDFIIPIMSDYDPQVEFGVEDPEATWLFFFKDRGKASWTPGDEFQIQYVNPLIAGVDEYEFSTPANIRDDRELALSQVDRINVFPNPYLGANIEERDGLHRFVRFTHLEGEVTIRIFTLAGTIVRIIEHDGSSQFCEWDLRNAHGLAVASGIYLALLDLKTLGAQKMLKLAILQTTERPDTFFVK